MTAPDGGPRSPRRERLSRDHELFLRLRRDGDLRARDELVARFLKLAVAIARRHRGDGAPFDDVRQVASIGLLKAIDRFDPDRGVAFSSFAVPTIDGELKRFFRDHAWFVRPPRVLQESALRVERAMTQLAAGLGRTPTGAELCRYTGLREDAVVGAMQARLARHGTSLDAPRDDADDADDGVARGAMLGGADEGYARAEERAILAGLSAELTARERVALHLRFTEDMTQAGVGAVLGISQMQASRVIRTAVDRLCSAAEAGDEES